MWKGTIFYLSEKDTEPEPRAIGIPTGEEAKRVPPQLLENIYKSDPVVFNGINVYYKTILSNPPKIIASNEKEQRYMDLFAKRVRLFGSVIPKICQNMLIFGNAWNEICYKKGDENKPPHERDIIRLFDRDPKYMDFRRAGINNRIVYDEFQEPKSYVLYLDYNIPSQPNEIMQMGKRAIELPKWKIMHTPFITLGDSYDGVGLIEPLYNSAIGKVNAEKGFTRHIYRLGHALVGVKVGSPDTIFPSKDQIDKAAEIFKDINESTTIAYPYYMQPEIIESKKGVEKLREQINYYIDQEIAGLGLPACMVTGRGEAMNRSVLDKLMVVFYQHITMIQNRISTSLEDNVFTKIYNDKNFDEVPKLVWPEISMESLASKAERLTSYIKSGALTPSPEIERKIKEWEGLK